MVLSQKHFRIPHYSFKNAIYIKDQCVRRLAKKAVMLGLISQVKRKLLVAKTIPVLAA